jgi:hypothetical protein
MKAAILDNRERIASLSAEHNNQIKHASEMLSAFIQAATGSCSRQSDAGDFNAGESMSSSMPTFLS